MRLGLLDVVKNIRVSVTARFWGSRTAKTSKK
jgi:hypothetical protein